MRPIVSTLALLLTLAFGAAVGAAPDKVKLLYKAQAGQVARYRSEASLQIDAAGMKVATEIAEVEKVTFTAVGAEGNITLEKDTESTEATINGQKLPAQEDSDGKTTVVMRPNGALVSLKGTTDTPEQSKLSVRMFTATTPIFPDTEIGVGSKWNQDYKANPDTGQSAAKADFELLAFEKVATLDAAKVKMTYRETEGSPALSVRATLWIELTSADTIKGDFEIEGLPFGGGEAMVVASGKLHQERIGGGPLGGPKGADGKPAAVKPKTIDELVKDYEKLPGLFTVYRKKEAGRETMYLELREDQLGQLYFLQATASTGTGGAVVAGDPLSDILFKFATAGDDRLLMVTPNINFTAAEGSPISRSVKRAFADGYLDSFKIEARQAERKSMLINVSEMFRNDIAQVSSVLGGNGITGATLGGYSLDKEKTFLQTFKVFPDNLYVETAYHFFRGGSSSFGATLAGGSLADARSLPLRVNFNLFALDNKGYRPRLADPRVGYFYTEFQDFTDDGKDTQMVRYILRWDLEKQDPTAKLSAPKKPIVFWLDNAIPTEYRDSVRDGILMWNKSFQKIGFKDAVVVKQMPDNADFDHADMRYNVIRWSTTQMPPYGAIALFRTNPLTGQILNAGITVDASLTRFTKIEKRQEVDPATFFQEQPSTATRKLNPYRCELATGAMNEAWFGATALSLLAPAGVNIDEKAYTNNFVRAIVAHEMGHVLGLFHNFSASTQLSMEQLKDGKQTAEKGVIASVMDYVPFNIAALRQKNGEYWTSTVGAYDNWAVEYGYSALEADKPEGELAKLKAIAARCNEPGHAFHNDFEADAFDPLVTRFDLGSDPLAYWTRKLQVSRHLLYNLSPRLPRKGESYWEFTRAFNGLLNEYASSAAVASRYLGGLHLNANYRGDAGEKPVLVPAPAEKQREALRLLNTYIFAENAFNFPADYYKKLTNNPYVSTESMMLGGSGPRDFPVRNQFSSIQTAALRRVLSPAVLNRVMNNEFKLTPEEKPLTLPELFRSVGDTVWSELDGHKNIPALRRQLQRTHLDLLINTVLTPNSSTPEDARALGWDQLRQIKSRMMASRSHSGLDDYTRVHLDESLMRIHRALNATNSVGGNSGGGGSLLQLLLGGQKPDGSEAAPAAK